ncbi:MAG: Serine/threonine protein kinase PrkC, regulator of stationary phase [Labilithrix sp.]|nr:Serine/threonine protein kinase PrkC, regulator of stationary phase [Labilithrix sp.]
MPDSPITPGEVLAGKYRVERMLGEGGHGVVVAAQHLALGERVAIKLLRAEVSEDAETVERFLREARAAVRIKGEHVTRVLDVGSLENGTPYMVMEYLEGSDLSNLVETKGWLPVSVAVDYVLQSCEALAEAHALGIVHRDIKPSNLFLTSRPDGTACIKVLDFGISKSMPAADGPAADLTSTQSVLGSPQYMAPEQMRSSKRVDGRTDIWALGTTLHELLTGRAPFEAQTMPELFAMILMDTPPRLAERRPEMPPALELVVARCLEKDPQNRFADVHQLARALAPFGTSMSHSIVERIGRVGAKTGRTSDHFLPIDAGSAPGVDLSRTTERTGTPVIKKERSFLPFAAGGLLIALLGGAAIFFAVGRTRPPHLDPVTASPPPSASEVPVRSSPSSTPIPASDPSPPAADSADSAALAPSATAKKNEPHGKSPPPRQASSIAVPPATASVPPTPPSTPPRTPGVASSRYD